MAEFRPFVPNATDFHPQEVTDTDTIRSGGANFLGAVTMNTNKITGMGDPTAPQDAATKAYVDAIDAGLDPKESVRLATDAALPAHTPAGSGVGKTLTADANGALTVDGVAAAAGDRIAYGVHTGTPDLNFGIYDVTDAGSGATPWILTRATDFDQDIEVTQGARTFVAEGTNRGKQVYMIVTGDPITVDTTAIAWSIIGDNSELIGGDGVDITGNTISVDLDTNPGLEFNAAALRVDVADANELSLSAAGLNVEGVPALFNIGATPVGATVTAPNLDTLTDGSNADALHAHAALGNPQETTDGTGVTIGDALYYSGNGIVSEADAANDTAKGVVALADATVGASAAVGLATEGDSVIPASIGGAPAFGDLVYIANGGGLTVTRPAASGDRVVVIGKMRNATEVRVGPGQFLGQVA
jgi:hypothetical protein